MKKESKLIKILALSAFMLVNLHSYSGVYRNQIYRDKEKQTNYKEYTKENVNRLKEFNELFMQKYLASFKDPFRTDDFSKDKEDVLLARLILGEGEGCSKLEKLQIGYSTIVRAEDDKKWNGTTVKEAILAKDQYEAMAPNSSRSKNMKNPMAYNPKEFLDCLNLSQDLLAGKYDGKLKKVTHFYNPHMISPPSWTNKMIRVGKIDNSIHIFYLEP